MEKLKVSAISYLNTTPFVYGLRNSAVIEQVDISFHTPSECARMLKAGLVDMGIVPVAVVPDLTEYHIIGSYCIGAVGKVRSVAVYATAPLEELDTIYLDFESRTSVLLCQVLAREYWKVNPTFSPLRSLAEVDTKRGKVGYVLIGDKTFGYDGLFPYKYDLAEEWMAFRKLPFVFAAWVANKPLDSLLVQQFDEAFGYGVKNIAKVVEQDVHNFDKGLALDYLTNNISYDFDCAKQEGLSNFWELALGVKAKVRCCR